MAVALLLQLAPMTEGFVARRVKQAASLVVLIGLAIGAFYAGRYVEMLIILSSVVGSHDLVANSVANQRGDTVEISTETSGNQQAPARIVLRLKRAHDWFSTTLLETESYGFRWNPKWTDDNILDLFIGFGCVERLGHPVTMVGQIRISYHFTYDDTDLDLDLARSGRSDPDACRTVHHSGSPRS